MKTWGVIVLLFLSIYGGFAQDGRVEQIKNNIEVLLPDVPGLGQKVNINIRETDLSTFLIAVSEVHKVNLSVSPELKQIAIINNFTDVSVADLLVFLCKEYQLHIDFTGNILSVKTYQKPVEKSVPKEIIAGYEIEEDLLTLDLKDDKLYDVFKKIMDVSGKNLVFSPGLEGKSLTAYIKNMPFDAALNKLAFSNNLVVTKSRDNFYMFERIDESGGAALADASGQPRAARPVRQRKSNFYFQVLDKEQRMLEVDFENTPVANIIYDIGHELGIDMFVSSPLTDAGNATVKAKQISFDELLVKIFESAQGTRQSSTSQGGMGSAVNQNFSQSAETGVDTFTFLVKEGVYFFGLKSQLVVRKIKTLALMHRSIELLNDPNKEGRSVGRLNNQASFTTFNSFDNRSSGQGFQQQSQSSQTVSANEKSESILTLIPAEIKEGLDIKIDTELNSFIISGPSENINRFESFIKYIDKPVPVILIEVMLLEISRSALIETGISAGIGEKPKTTIGTVYPTPDITLGAATLNKIINRFDGFGSLNVGSVIPEFYLSLKAMEANGDLKIRSSPRLSTLNGHRAFLSIGETTYYVVTNQNFYGSQIPQASEIKNYQPIDAELSLTIKPLVSGDGQITMDIKVIQSSFNGQKVDKDAPPGINSREFTSIIRVKDQDLIVLGGLEEKVRSDSGSGIPFLARIPVIKWLFSSRSREDSRKKLTVLIKPTVIY